MTSHTFFKHQNLIHFFETEEKNLLQLHLQKNGENINTDVYYRNLKALYDVCVKLEHTQLFQHMYYPSLSLTPTMHTSFGEWIFQLNKHPFEQLDTSVFLFSGIYFIHTTLNDIFNNTISIWWNDASQCARTHQNYQYYDQHKNRIDQSFQQFVQRSTVYVNPEQILFYCRNGDFLLTTLYDVFPELRQTFELPLSNACYQKDT